MSPDPTGAGGLTDALYQNGPLGFLAAFALFAFLFMREVRRYRDIDLRTARDREDALKKDNAELNGELQILRDQSFGDGKEATAQRVQLARDNARMRLLLAQHNIDPDDGNSGP